MEIHCVFVFLLFAVSYIHAQRDYVYPDYTQMPNNYYPRPWDGNRYNTRPNFNEEPYMVNRYDTRTSIIEAPFMALIFADHSFREYPFMTGVIITNQWILTTAKTLEIQKGKVLKVITGVDSLSSIDERYFNRVIKQVLHSKYRPDEVYNDIALVKVERPIIFSDRQRPIDLVAPNDLVYYQRNHNPRKNLTVFNYGSDNESSFGILKKNVISVNTEVVDFTERLFVAAQRLIPTCYGDTGSPAIVDGKLVGLLVIEYRCGNNFPNVFISISHYYDWIKHVLHF